jgi:hypothetical protein
MRAELTGAVRLEQPQYQAPELLIGVIAGGYRVLELPATIRKRKVGESKQGKSLIYGARFTRVVLRTWWRERRAVKWPWPAAYVRARARVPSASSGSWAGAA